MTTGGRVVRQSRLPAIGIRHRSVRTVGKLTRIDLDLWSTTATVVIESAAVSAAMDELDAELDAIEIACSRFLYDSEINAVLRSSGTEMVISLTLNVAMAAALRVAAATGYLVDPTVAAAVIALGYDRDIAAVRSDHARTVVLATDAARPAPGAWLIQHDVRARRLLVPVGVGVDLGATAKALAADRAANRIALGTGSGVLVSIGGDVAVAGPAPAGGWRIAVADDHRSAEADPQVTVAIGSGGLATSSTTARRWTTRAGERHHIVDPRTGENPPAVWRTASVAAGNCVDANAAATAAIVLADQAPAWLADRGMPARLVGVDGEVTLVGGWPADQWPPAQ